MGFQDFERVGEFRAKCKTCGAELPTGIISLSNHWTSCTGKGFYSALMSKAESGEKLTTDIVEQLQSEHLPKNK